MRAAYWIGILALAGGIIGYLVFRTTGWLGTGVGVVIGVIVGALLYAGQRRKLK